MMFGKRAMAGWLVITGAFVTSCAAVNVNREWQDPTARVGRHASMMVYSSCPDSIAARILEDAIVSDLTARGIDARPAYHVVGENDVTEPQLRGRLQAMGIDAIVLARMTGIENKVNYIPPTRYIVPRTYYNDFYRRFVTVYRHEYQPGYLDRYQVIEMQADLYDAESGRLLASLSTSQVKGSDMNADMRQFAKTLVNQWTHVHVLA